MHWTPFPSPDRHVLVVGVVFQLSSLLRVASNYSHCYSVVAAVLFFLSRVVATVCRASYPSSAGYFILPLPCAPSFFFTYSLPVPPYPSIFPLSLIPSLLLPHLDTREQNDGAQEKGDQRPDRDRNRGVDSPPGGKDTHSPFLVPFARRWSSTNWRSTAGTSMASISFSGCPSLLVASSSEGSLIKCPASCFKSSSDVTFSA